MLAGRPHEAVGNGSPRWMAAGPRKRVHRTRPTGRLARRLPSDLRLSGHVQPSRDERRGVEVPLVKPRSLRQPGRLDCLRASTSRSCCAARAYRAGS
jgi:hypothetical protein